MHDHNDHLKHWPPLYIVGKQIGLNKECIAQYEDELCKVELMNIKCDWNYSNPTGMYNLSLPDTSCRMQNYTSVAYKDYK